MYRAFPLSLLLLASTLPAQSTPLPRFTFQEGLDVATPTLVGITPDGRMAAMLVGSERLRLGKDHFRDNLPVGWWSSGELRIVDTKTGESKRINPGKTAASPVWSPSGDRLAFIAIDKEIGTVMVWDRASGKTSTLASPTGREITGGSAITWHPSGRELVVVMHPRGWREEFERTFIGLTDSKLVVMSSEAPFLGWEKLSRMAYRSSVEAMDARTGALRVLVPDTVMTYYRVRLSDDGTRVLYDLDTATYTPYGKNLKMLASVRVIVPAGDPAHDAASKRAEVERKKEVEVKWSKDGASYSYAKEGRLYLGKLGDTVERQLAGPPEKKTDAKPAESPAKKKSDAEKKAEAREKFALVAFDPGAQWMLASNTEGFWRINAADGAKRLVIVSDADTSRVKYQYESMTPDGRRLLFRSGATDRWQRGIHLYDPSTDRVQSVLQGESMFGGAWGSAPRLSDDGNTLVALKGEGSRPSDLHVVNVSSGEIRRLTTLNPSLEDPRTSQTRLISYLDADGRRQYGVLYLPWNYEEGKSYPTIFHLYEKFFDPEFDLWDQLLVAKGYAVIRPSVPTNTEHGYENEAWMKGAMAAATKLVEMGIADSARLGVYGCSYGGYATNFMVTQTKRFKAAVAISGMTNVVSLYTESPRLGLRNMNATEGRAQVRIGGTLWEQPEKYVSNSSIMQADRVETPLLIITGGLDHNVEVHQSAAMFYALRRLGKKVKWANFPKGGHCGAYGSEEELRDWGAQITSWFDEHLMKNASTAR